MNRDEFPEYLESAFRRKRQEAEELEAQKDPSLARVSARIQKRLKDDDLPESPGVDCQAVRSVLPLVADPLELTVMPAWLDEHLAACRDCRRELECLEECSQTITVSEMPHALGQEILADASPGFVKKVSDLRAVPPDKITCEQAKPSYRDAAVCSLEVPAEIYRHIRHCQSCRERIQQLRCELGMAIPQVGSAEFGKLLAKDGTLRLVPAAEGVWPRVARRTGTFMQRNWRKLTVGSAAAAIIIALLVISPGQAMAVTFEQVCAAFARIQFVRIRSMSVNTGAIRITTPQKETWYIREPLGRITLPRDGTYARFTAADGKFVEYSREGELQFSETYSGEKLQDVIRTLQADLDLRQNLGLGKFAKAGWSLLQQDVNVDGISTDIYELIVDEKEEEGGYQRRFEVYVDASTNLPVQIDFYEYAYVEDEQASPWRLVSIIKYAYPAEIPEEILNPKFARGD